MIKTIVFIVVVCLSMLNSGAQIKKDTEKSVPFSIVIPVISWVAMSYQLVNPTLLALIAELVKMTSVDNFCKNSTL